MMLVRLTLAAVMAVGLGSCEKKQASAGGAVRCAHEIKQEMCPFCNPDMVEKEGFCGEHGVAEALCYECRPYLKAAFKAKGDWCERHSAPESQCVECHPELLEKRKPGTGHGTGGPEGNG